MEPVAGIPHGGFYEGGRAQEANSLKARPYPPQSLDTSHLPVICPQCPIDITEPQ